MGTRNVFTTFEAPPKTKKAFMFVVTFLAWPEGIFGLTFSCARQCSAVSSKTQNSHSVQETDMPPLHKVNSHQIKKKVFLRHKDN